MANLTDLYDIHDFIDTFALGHYARVLEAQDRRTRTNVAFKVLRPEHVIRAEEPRWEFRAFPAEADLLLRMAASPHVVQLIDCGYVSSESEAPHAGEIESFGRDVAAFTAGVIRFSARGWRPYLALELLPRQHNLFYLMRPDRAGLRLRLPTEEGLALALQFGEMLKMAHRAGIVYLDHKLEHVYWDGVHLKVIDFNSSRLMDANPDNPAVTERTDVHNLCVGILYSIFTGLSPQKATLRPQPGGLSEVETRYQDVTTLDFGVEPTLSDPLQELLQRGASQMIDTAEQFVRGLQEVSSKHGWDFPALYTSPASRDARSQLRAGLARLRAGEAQIREARDLFRDAAVQDGISPEMEAELRRLVKAVNELLSHRVIP
jgi:serine/threonine protein kinase